jgi:hypothetical protein
VSRNVVTLVPRRLVLPTRRNRERQRRIVAAIHDRYRPQASQHGRRVMWEIHFPRSIGKRAAREQVVEELGTIDRRWRGLFVLYPTERALRIE